MPLSPEEDKRYRDQITKLLDAATPDATLPFARRQYKGSLGAHFQKLDTDMRVQMKANNISEPEINAAINERQKTERQQILDVYMNGVNKGPAAPDSQATEAVSTAAGLMGFGDGIFGWIAGMVAKIPVVGELVLSVMKMLGSGVGSLLGMVGLGDPNAKMLSFGEAQQQVRDSQAFANGANALVGTLGSGNAQLLAELQNMQGAAPSGSDIKRVGDDKALVKNNAGDAAETVKFLQSLRVPNASGKESTSADPASPQAQELANLILAKPELFKGKKTMAVTLADGSLAVASGDFSKDNTTMTITAITRVENKVLVTTAPPADMKPMETGIKPPPDTREVLVNKSESMAMTLSDNQEALEERIGSLKQVGVGLSQPLVDLLTVMGKDGIKFQENPAAPDQKLDPKLKTVMVVLPGGMPAVLSGSFDPDTNKFTPLFVTTVQTKEDGTKLQKTEKLTGATPREVKPTFSGSNVINDTVAKDMKQLLSALQDQALVVPSENEAQVAKLTVALEKALTDNSKMFLQSQSTGTMHHMVVIMPGGDAVIISGTSPDDGKTMNAMYKTRVKGDTLQSPETISTTPSIKLDMTTGKSLGSVAMSDPSRSNASDRFNFSETDFNSLSRPSVPDTGTGRSVA